jgi:hypothetical protein
MLLIISILINQQLAQKGVITMIINKEYELAFPVDQEYNLWINSIEQDYQQEAKHRAKLVVTNRTQFVDEDLSPFNTVNS